MVNLTRDTTENPTGNRDAERVPASTRLWLSGCLQTGEDRARRADGQMPLMMRVATILMRSPPHTNKQHYSL